MSAATATQGHRYLLDGGVSVLAVSSGASPRVMVIHEGPNAPPFPGWPFEVSAERLTAVPMVYFHGEVPR